MRNKLPKERNRAIIREFEKMVRKDPGMPVKKIARQIRRIHELSESRVLGIIYGG